MMNGEDVETLQVIINTRNIHQSKAESIHIECGLFLCGARCFFLYIDLLDMLIIVSILFPR